MPEKLEEEKIEEVIEAYEEEGSYAGAATKTGVSKPTVKKYVNRRLETDDGDSGGSSDSASGSAFIEMDDGSDRLVDLTDEELMEMRESEFIRTFFREFDDMGVRDSFAEMIANQAQVRGQIPDEDQMSQRLQSHNSGVGNANDANAIAELYWALAQRYLNARGLAASGRGASGQMATGTGAGSFSGGEWVGAPDGGRGRGGPGGQQQGGDGEWVNTNPGQPGGQQQPPGQQRGGRQGGGMEQMFQQMMAQQQQMMRQMMEKQQEDENDELRAEIARLREEVDSDDGGSDNMTDSLKELMELREMLNQLEGDDGDDRMEQVVGTLQQQLSALQQEIRDGNSSANVAEMMSGGDSQMGMLMALAQSGDMDPEEIVPLAQKLGEVETNPQVAEKKYEKQIEEMKVEAEQEKWDSILTGVEELATSFGDVLGGDLPIEGGEESDGEQEPREPDAVRETAESVEQSPEEAMSPAERLVSGGGEPDPAAEEQPVESEEITPDSTPEEAVEVEVVDGGETVMVDEESDLVGEEVEPDGGAAAVEDDAPAETEQEPDGDLFECTNDGCDRKFESEMGRRGHLGSCPHGDN